MPLTLLSVENEEEFVFAAAFKVTRSEKMASAYLTHHQKVLRLYKKSLRHLESWCIFR